MKRRSFLTGTIGAGMLAGSEARALTGAGERSQVLPAADKCDLLSRPDFGGSYEGPYADCIGFPMGGMGAGMICLEGRGSLASFSLRHFPDLQNNPFVFAALWVKGSGARVLEGPIPRYKRRPVFPLPASHPTFPLGLPRFSSASFQARFPFATVTLQEDSLPLSVRLEGWSPFIPGRSDTACLPVVGLEYHFENPSAQSVEAVFSFNSAHFMSIEPKDGSLSVLRRIDSTPGGFILRGGGIQPRSEGACAIWVDEPQVQVDHAWFGGTSDVPFHRLWDDLANGQIRARPPASESAAGASLFVPIRLGPGEQRTVVVKWAWYVPYSDQVQPPSSSGHGPQLYSDQTYRPWYAGRFESIEQVKTYWQDRYAELRSDSETFSRTLNDSTLPAEVMEAVTANLSILKSPTVLRQLDGRLWGWEGCAEVDGYCYGSSTHVWNYAQALAHLFPDLERSLRDTEFGENQNAQGEQRCRAALPIRVPEAGDPGIAYPAADAQLGGLLKIHREWRISGDTAWLRQKWPRVKASLDYCIRTWDPRERGAIEEPHLTTYDKLLWGSDGLCNTLYVGALTAAVRMGERIGEPTQHYADLLRKATRHTERVLFNGEYFQQRTQWHGLKTAFPPSTISPWLDYPQDPPYQALMVSEGPLYQYGDGCLTDGVFGVWLAAMCGLSLPIDQRKVKSHLQAVHRYNFKAQLGNYPNTQRVFGFEQEGGTLICTWPKQRAPTIPLIDACEVWSGIEYQAAGHLILCGEIDKGLELIRAVRGRYDGRVRNPFAEVEAGHWYARAMASYGLLQAMSGARYDAVDRVLHLSPAIKGDFRCFLATATGYGTVGVRQGKAFVEVVSGSIPYNQIEFLAS